MTETPEEGYPKLLKHRSTSKHTILLAIARSVEYDNKYKGTVLESSQWPVGTYSDTWTASSFKEVVCTDDC